MATTTKQDFYELLELGPLKLRSKRGLANVYELYGRNFTGQYLHLAYRREARRTVVFHTENAKQKFGVATLSQAIARGLMHDIIICA